MSRVFFANELEGVATWWKVLRRDGVALGFTSHNRDLHLDGITYRAAPGMVPSAIRRTARLERDAVEVEGVLAHDSISPEDLRSGRFAGARISIGLVDWETRERTTFFQGELGDISYEAGSFEAELRSAKAALEADIIPRTSPTCRADFCDAQCRANPASFTYLCALSALDLVENTATFAQAPETAKLHGGWVKWIDGPHAGITMQILATAGNELVLEQPLSATLESGTMAYLREGCDHTIATCASRFNNAANFRGEPHLPGNDLLARYPSSGA